jgi:serine protease Do
VREFVYSDAVARRVKQSESAGVVAGFVENNSPASNAGLRTEDWIKQIDGAAVAWASRPCHSTRLGGAKGV